MAKKLKSATKINQALLLNDADYAAHIPMLGAHSSMNKAMAAAIVVYEIGRGLCAGNSKKA